MGRLSLDHQLGKTSTTSYIDMEYMSNKFAPGCNVVLALAVTFFGQRTRVPQKGGQQSI